MGEIESILDSVKKKLGIDPEGVTEFDADLIDDVNMALNILTQLGVGPIEGYNIHGNTETWTDFLGSDPRLNIARSYVYLKVRLLFNPPQSSSILQEMNQRANELEWRICLFLESPKTFPGVV